MIARRIRITGTVQGVFYRAWAREQARELGLTGWVRNCLDGSVEAYLEGDGNAIERMIERMRQGPPAARVDEVQVEEAAPEGFNGFEVRH